MNKMALPITINHDLKYEKDVLTHKALFAPRALVLLADVSNEFVSNELL